MIKYVHTNIITKDWERLASFYKNVFNCETVPPQRDLSGTWLDKGTHLNNAHLTGVHLRLPGCGDYGPTLEIFQYDEVEDNLIALSNRKGLTHIAFAVDDVEEVLSGVLKNGGSNYGEVVSKQFEGIGTLTFTYAKDPDGNIIEIQQWKRRSGD